MRCRSASASSLAFRSSSTTSALCRAYSRWIRSAAFGSAEISIAVEPRPAPSGSAPTGTNTIPWLAPGRWVNRAAFGGATECKAPMLNGLTPSSGGVLGSDSPAAAPYNGVSGWLIPLKDSYNNGSAYTAETCGCCCCCRARTAAACAASDAAISRLVPLPLTLLT
ncbi:hypothetical protein Vafri_21143 [Volvox africanus]|nr:hypothetical protein Vafri_21143 [Volvox africanus]